MFWFLEISERNNGVKKKAEFVPKIMCWSITMFFLALLAIFASPSPCLKLYGYGFHKICFLDHNTNCDLETEFEYRKQQEKIFFKLEVQLEIKLKFSMYEAAFTVSALKKATI